MKMLIFNKMRKGMSYQKARKQLSSEIEKIIENSKTKKKKSGGTFKEKFAKLKNEKK